MSIKMYKPRVRLKPRAGPAQVMTMLDELIEFIHADRSEKAMSNLEALSSLVIVEKDGSLSL